MTTLKPMLNEVDIVGRVKEIDLQEGTTKTGKENISGTVTVLVKESVGEEIRNHDIKVRVYSNKFKANGDINGLFSGYKTVKDEYKSIKDTGSEQEADLVHVQGSLELNEYIGQDGAKHSLNRVSAKFFNRIDKEQAKKLRGPKAIVKIEGVLTGVKPVLDSEGLPEDSRTIELMNVDFFGELRDDSKPIVVLDAYVPEEIAETFEDLYEKEETGKFTLKINNYAEEAEPQDVEEISGFGDVEELKKVKRNFVNNLELIGGTQPYQEPKAQSEEQVKEIKQWRKKALSSLEEGYVPEEKKKKEENAFGAVPVDEDSIEDLDF